MGDDEPEGWPAGLIAGGLLVGLAIGLVAAWSLADRSATDGHDAIEPLVGPPPTLGPESGAAAQAFIEDWERSRRATYLTVSEWHRRTDVGAELRQTRVFAQRPPDRIRAAGDSIAGEVDGVRHLCDELDDGEVECRAFIRDQQRDYDERVERERELMWRHVEGTNPLYRVSTDGECYLLRLARAMVVPPYGHRTTYCFDPESGAVSEFRIERAEGTDEERTIWITTEVTDDDLQAITDGTFDPTSVLGR